MPRNTPVIRSDTLPLPIPASLYRLRIALEGISPHVWRQIEVLGETTLTELSNILLAAMGWDGSHLHQYVARGSYYGQPHPDYGVDILNEAHYTLADIAPKARDCFRFEYDFGDNWSHNVTVQAILPAEEGANYPRCIDGANACPPEDCGGIWGYQDLLRWRIGGSLDPERFSVDEANTALHPFVGKLKRRRA